MRKEVDLCDNCERTMSDGNCVSCGSDVCRKCSWLMSIFPGNSYYVSLNISKRSFSAGNPAKSAVICKQCFKQLFDRKILSQNPKPLMEEIIKLVKTHAVALKV